MQHEAVHVLLVEDDGAHADLIRHAFEESPGEMALTVAGSLEEARGCVAKSTPHLVIADLLLPDGKGTDLLAKNGGESAFPVVLMTSFGNEQAAVEAMKAGALDYLVKSVDTLADMPHFARRALQQWQHVVEKRQAEKALQEAHDELEGRVWERAAELLKANQQLKQEIEDRKRAEGELAILLSFAEASIQGFAMSDLQGRLTYANPTLCRLFGVEKAEDLLGKSLAQFYPEDVQKQVESEVAATVIQQGQWVGELPLRAGDAAVIPTLQNAFLIRDEQGKPLYLANVITDISERKEAERALRQSHDELRAIYDCMTDGLLIADVETGRFVRANGSICRMLGYSEEELLSMSINDIHPPEELLLVLEKFNELAEGQLLLCENLPTLRKDGSVFYVDIAARNIVYHQRPCAVGFFRDITERKKAEEAIRAEQKKLKRLLDSHERERQLIAYEIHDGLAQHLTGAKMQLQSFELLKGDNPEGAATAFGTALDLITRGIDEVRQLISGLRPPILDESGVVAAIEHLIHRSSQQEGPEVGLEVDVSFDRLEPLLENAIFRIVQESLTNARRHSQSDKVQVVLTQTDQRIRIEIRDWGVGFRPEDVPESCFGVGSIRERARLLDGRAEIDSAPGRGTHVTVELPLAEIQ